jgi:hypothetical protein
MVRNTTQLAHIIKFDFDENTSDDLYRDREFIALAQAEIADGKSIAYFAWWSHRQTKKGDASAPPFQFYLLPAVSAVTRQFLIRDF